MDETIRNALRAYLEEMKKPAEERDAARLAEAEKAIAAAAANTDDGKAGEVLAAVKAEVEQLRKDLDAAAEERRKLARQSLLVRTGDGTVATYKNGHAKMRFPDPEMAREFADFARKVYTARTGGPADKALTTGGASGEGYVIPDTFHDTIDRMVETVGFARQYAGPIPLGPGANDFARRLAGAVAYFKTEGAEATESAPSFGTYSMTARTLIALLELSVEFEEDVMLDIGNYVATEFTYAISDKEDDCAINGDGTADYGLITGILESTYVTVKTMDGGDDGFTDLNTMDYLTDLESEVWDGALADANYLMSRSILALVKKIKDSAGLPIWQPPAASAPGEILGYPYARSGKMPALSATDVSTRFVAFGDFRRGLKFGRRGTYRLDWSPHPGFKNYTNCWRAVERIAMSVVGFTAAEIAANPELGNPIAVLRTAAE